LRVVKEPGPALERFQAALGVAAVAVLTEKANEALPALEYAQACQKEVRKAEAKIPAWDLVQLARLLAAAGKAEEARGVVQTLPDKAAKSRAQLELLLARLAASREQVPMNAADEIDKESLSYGLALEALARHNTRVGQQGAVREAIDAADERHRPFLYAGLALGLQDGRK
jgi:hypothetical protein